MAEIDAIFNPAPETESSRKEADVEMEMTSDQIERILNPDGAKKYADDSAESEQIWTAVSTDLRSNSGRNRKRRSSAEWKAAVQANAFGAFADRPSI